MSDHHEAVVVRPWYRQFYLRRGDAEWCSDRISDDGYARGLEAIEGFVYVGTTMYGSPTEVVVRVHVADPGPHGSADRHVDTVLGGDGDLAVLNWEPGEPPVTTIGLPSGTFALRASWFDTAAAAQHHDVDLGGDKRSPEHIALDLWPATQLPICRALRCTVGPTPGKPDDVPITALGRAKDGASSLGTTSKLISLAAIACVLALGTACSDEATEDDSNDSTWICIAFSTSDWQGLADVEGEFIDEGELVDGVTGYHSTSSPPRLSLELESDTVAEDFLSSMADRLERHSSIASIEVVGSDCA